MLLRNSARYSSAVELINTIKAAVDAIDKGYLKELMLTVYLVRFSFSTFRPVTPNHCSGTISAPQKSYLRLQVRLFLMI